ncbi:hypothetical protein [Bacterioplanoides sp.]|uniref:hypothetical protein n=1 Tax=Bacterioplanoides sp. TaxID=2066072 RepID=UPI003AFFFB09
MTEVNELYEHFAADGLTAECEEYKYRRDVWFQHTNVKWYERSWQVSTVCTRWNIDEVGEDDPEGEWSVDAVILDLHDGDDGRVSLRYDTCEAELHISSPNETAYLSPIDLDTLVGLMKELRAGQKLAEHAIEHGTLGK